MQNVDIKTSKLNETVNILKVLAHPIRYGIALTLQRNGVMNVGAIQKSLSLPQSTVSQHISKMRQVGIVEDNRDGTKIYYELVDSTAIKIMESLADI